MDRAGAFTTKPGDLAWEDPVNTRSEPGMTPEQRAAAVGVLTQAMLAAGVSGDDAAKAAPALVDEAGRQQDAGGDGTVTAQLAAE